MNLSDINCCLDCDYAGPLVRINGAEQCPRCASHATWPVSSWTKSAAAWSPPYHQHRPRTGGLPHQCCDLTPTFLGGTLGAH